MSNLGSIRPDVEFASDIIAYTFDKAASRALLLKHTIGVRRSDIEAEYERAAGDDLVDRDVDGDTAGRGTSLR